MTEPRRDTPARDPRAALSARVLERLIGRAPSTWTADDLVTLVGERGIRLVTLMHVGAGGELKALDFVPQSATHLREILTAGERADGTSLFPGLNASDIVLRPRLPTAFLDPFAPHPTLAVLCEHVGRDGAPLSASPSTVVRRACERLERETGVMLQALGEVEFYLGRPTGEANISSMGDGGYHATAPSAFGEDLRRRALVHLTDIGVPLKYAHAESGRVAADGVTWEQHEIELGLAPLPDAADAVALARWVLGRLAQAEGLQVCFEPLLRRGHASCGLHFHLAAAAIRDGAILRVHDGDGALTESARHLIGGLVRHAGALMAFGNRADSSFARLEQARSTPTGVTWGDDRRALVRLPMAGDGAGPFVPTIEFRLSDGSAHPHLLLAGVAQAMMAAGRMADLDALLDATAATQGGARRDQPSVPHSRAEVAAGLRDQRGTFEAGGVFPPALIDSVISALEKEAPA